MDKRNNNKTKVKKRIEVKLFCIAERQASSLWTESMELSNL